MIDLGTQLKSFKTVKRRLRSALGEAETKRIFSRAVYLFNIGGNDLFYALFQTSSLVNLNAKQKLVDLIIGNTTSVVEVNLKWKTDLKFIIFGLENEIYIVLRKCIKWEGGSLDS